jgi:hypothetical protein
VLRHSVAFLLLWFVLASACFAEVKRVVIIKLDGVPQDALDHLLQQIDPLTGKSDLPWIDYVFVRHGARLRNFYVRAISLSAPSWSLLDTGRHLQIRGNAEFDRYTYHVYDYLNFFPFYLGYALSHRVDMPGVEVLDQLGIPLLIDRFPFEKTYQSFQLYQRGVRWKTLQHALQHRFSRSPRDLLDEWTMGFEIGSSVEEQTERELISKLGDPSIQYLDYFSGDYDHVAHLTPDLASRRSALQRVDALIGRVWTAIEAGPLANATALVVVSDHGMNSDPGVYSQGYDLVDFLNSRAGGAHHVVTDRHPMTEYKLKGLDPFVSEVVTPSSESIYLKGAGNDYPTALLDLDGNERAAVDLRNSALNALHILLDELNRSALAPVARRARIDTFFEILDRHRPEWQSTVRELLEELGALQRWIDDEREKADAQPKRWTSSERDAGLDKAARRFAVELDSRREQHRRYSEYVTALQKLLALSRSDFDKHVPPAAELIPKRAMGDANTVDDLQNYIIGPAPDGGFERINYFSLLTGLAVRNNVQPGVGSHPVDFIAARLPDGSVRLYADENHQAVITSRRDPEGVVELRYQASGPGPGYPLRLREDADFAVPESERDAWLSRWHTELDWFHAVHRTKYSNAILALVEQFQREPEATGLLARFDARRRRLAEPDFLIFANNHWNFNVRGFNPGGNHGSFFRASTHSVLMFAGAEIPQGLLIEEPYDSLSFVPTVLDSMGFHNDANTLPGRPIRELLRVDKPRTAN